MYMAWVDATYRLVALVSALVPKCLFIDPDEVFVGWEEMIVVVQLHGVRHMVGHEVIESADSARELVLGRSCWELHQALHGFDILFSLGNAEIAPLSSHGGIGQGAVVVCSRSDLLGKERLDFGPGGYLDFIHDIEGVDPVTNPDRTFSVHDTDWKLRRETYTFTLAAYDPATVAGSATATAPAPKRSEGSTRVVQEVGIVDCGIHRWR
jgi:hypothetical protein